MGAHRGHGYRQRALAAFFAISLRRAGESASARALPPLRPPRRPRLTAAGSFSRSGFSGAASPVTRFRIENAVSFGSAGPGFFLERSGMRRGCHDRPRWASSGLAAPEESGDGPAGGD